LGEETKIRFTLTARRVRIDPEKKRWGYIERLETLVEQLDSMINNPRMPRKLKLRSMEVLIKTVNACYGIVSDIEVETLEDEVQRLKDQGTDEKDALGYIIPKDFAS
jgi:hypothetical protein